MTWSNWPWVQSAVAHLLSACFSCLAAALGRPGLHLCLYSPNFKQKLATSTHCSFPWPAPVPWQMEINPALFRFLCLFNLKLANGYNAPFRRSHRFWTMIGAIATSQKRHRDACSHMTPCLCANARNDILLSNIASKLSPCVCRNCQINRFPDFHELAAWAKRWHSRLHPFPFAAKVRATRCVFHQNDSRVWETL